MSDDVRATTLALLARRAPDARVCPSEVARAVAADAGRAEWRADMSAVHDVIEQMAAEGLIRLSWKGEARQVRDGPYRIGRA